MIITHHRLPPSFFLFFFFIFYFLPLLYNEWAESRLTAAHVATNPRTSEAKRNEGVKLGRSVFIIMIIQAIIVLSPTWLEPSYCFSENKHSTLSGAVQPKRVCVSPLLGLASWLNVQRSLVPSSVKVMLLPELSDGRHNHAKHYSTVKRTFCHYASLHLHQSLPMDEGTPAIKLQ